MEPVISVKNVTKEYRLGALSTGAFITDVIDMGKSLLNRDFHSEKEILKAVNNVSFDVFDGDILGVVGGNGAGKSTLLKLLSRITIPTKGEIEIKGKMSSLLEVGTGFHPELTGRENIYLNGTILGMSKFEIDSKLDQIIEFSGVEKFLDTPVKRYSSGMVVRLGFSVAAFLEPDILVVDEVLAVGDSAFQEKCLGRLKDISSKGQVVLFVSHNLQSLKKLCTRGILIQNGKLVLDSTIENVLESYVSKTQVGIENGIIPKEMKRALASGEILIRRFQLVDRSINVINQLYFRQPLRCILDVDRSSNVTDVYFTALIFNKDGDKIAHCDKEITSFVKLIKDESFLFDLNITLTPGSYYVDVTLYNEAGGQYDYIQNCYQFEVMNISFENFSTYSGAKISGTSYSEMIVETKG